MDIHRWCEEIFDGCLTKVLIKADPVEHQTEQGQIAAYYFVRMHECLFCHPNNFVHFCFMPMDISSVHFLIDSENVSCSDVKLLLKTWVKLT